MYIYIYTEREGEREREREMYVMLVNYVPYMRCNIHTLCIDVVTLARLLPVARELSGANTQAAAASK